MPSTSHLAALAPVRCSSISARSMPWPRLARAAQVASDRAEGARSRCPQLSGGHHACDSASTAVNSRPVAGGLLSLSDVTAVGTAAQTARQLGPAGRPGTGCHLYGRVAYHQTGAVVRTSVSLSSRSQTSEH